jgi:Tol biopolymer transport system component
VAIVAKHHVLRQLAFLAIGLVVVLVVAGQLARAGTAPVLRNDSRPVWSYDARYLAFTIGSSTAAIVPAAHGPERVLRPGTTRGWRPGGSEFLNQVGAETYVVANDGRIVTNVPGTFAAWSPDGGTIAYIRDGALYVAAATGAGEQKLFGPFSLPTWELEGPVWSPDGSRILIATTDGLRIVRSDGSGSKLIYTGANQSVNPTWSPSTGQIAFETNAGPHWSIWMMNADGTNAHSILGGGASDFRFPQFSSIGNRLAYISDTQHIRGGATPYQYALYIADLNVPRAPYRVLDDVRPDEPAVWSPTSAQLAAAAGEECGRWGIYIVPSQHVALPHGRRRTNVCRFDGTAQNDTLRGSPYHDLMNGNGGNDVLYGNGGPDKVSGDNGNDTIHGGAGNDFILGGPGNDRIFGGAGNDVIIGGNGRDQIDCGAGNDTVEGAGRLDVIARNCEHVRR